jgi:hypothetical protein
MTPRLALEFDAYAERTLPLLRIPAPAEPSDAERVLRILRDARGAWVPDLYRRTGCMVHSRISDLRRRGHNIESKCFGKGDYRYRLIQTEGRDG